MEKEVGLWGRVWSQTHLKMRGQERLYALLVSPASFPISPLPKLDTAEVVE
jgi:hypothetical protein